MPVGLARGRGERALRPPAGCSGESADGRGGRVRWGLSEAGQARGRGGPGELGRGDGPPPGLSFAKGVGWGVCLPLRVQGWGETEHPFPGNSRPGPKKTWAGSAVRARGGGLTSRRAASGEDAGAQGSQVAPDAPPRAVGTSTRGRRGARPSVPGPRPKVGVRTTPSTLGRGTFGRPTTTTSPPPHPHTTILKLWF